MGLRVESQQPAFKRGVTSIKRLSTRVAKSFNTKGKQQQQQQQQQPKRRIPSEISELETSRGADVTEHNALDEQGLAVVKMIANELEARLESEKCVNKNDCFTTGRVPPVGLFDYFARLARYVNVWRCHAGGAESAGVRAAVLAFMYLERIQDQRPEFALTRGNVHRLAMVGFLVATKFSEDKPIGNDFWSKVGGVPMSEVNRLESAFCSLLDFRFYVDENEYSQVLDHFNLPEF